MNEIMRGQVINSAAKVYDEFFLPALFEEWTDRVLKTAHIKPGQTVLDVACGTGVLTLAVAEQVGPTGSVTGVDINEGMLAVARKKSNRIVWQYGEAEDLPFPDRRFDRVISQFGLMFFRDRQKAIHEMTRVLKPGGRLAIAVWDTLENTPGYAAAARLLERLFGTTAANTLESPYVLGDIEVLKSLFSGVDLVDIDIKTHQGTAKFPSLDTWMYTDVKGWTLADKIDDAQFKLLVMEARKDLGQFIQKDGTIRFKAPAHIITASKG